MNKEIAIILIFSMCILGPALIIASAGFASINALGRNPTAAPKIFTAMAMMIIFGASISIVALMVLFQIYSP